MTAEQQAPRTEARSLLGKLLGRHHREMLLSGDHCAACHNFSPTVDEVRAAIEQEAARPLPEPQPEIVERLADAVHGAMCEVSHHGVGSICKHQRKYEMIAESIYARLPRLRQTKHCEGCGGSVSEYATQSNGYECRGVVTGGALPDRPEPPEGHVVGDRFVSDESFDASIPLPDRPEPSPEFEQGYKAAWDRLHQPDAIHGQCDVELIRELVDALDREIALHPYEADVPTVVIEAHNKAYARLSQPPDPAAEDQS